MRRIVLRQAAAVILSIFILSAASADEAAQCQAGAGSYLTGRVIGKPVFASGKRLEGVELSHTHLTLKSDRDGKLYDVAIDNVFADGYTKQKHRIPYPLSTIRSGSELELCGLLYAGGELGIHWVHTNCGETPTADQPDGWVKIVAENGTPGQNLESSQKYCDLWSRR